jgi:hypothetical protein
MSNQSPTANSRGQSPEPPFERHEDKQWSPTQDEDGTTDVATDRYETIGPDKPMGDREGADEDWTPERVEEVSKREVKNPQEPERDIEESERKD